MPSVRVVNQGRAVGNWAAGSDCFVMILRQIDGVIREYNDFYKADGENKEWNVVGAAVREDVWGGSATIDDVLCIVHYCAHVDNRGWWWWRS